MHRWIFAVLTIALVLTSGLTASSTRAEEAAVTPSSDALTEATQTTTATIYYVRPDGGTTTQCTGRSDAAYPGSGTGRACAWKHPFYALPPYGTPRIAGGDTLIIGAGSYKMGLGAPGAEACTYAPASYDCHMPAIPSGPNTTQRTRILGRGWNTGCTSAPELWGSGRPWQVVSLKGSSNVEIACLEITDHSKCIENYDGDSSLRCRRADNEYPYGDWAANGIWAEDSSNVILRRLNIHGIAGTGVVGGRLSNWLVEDVKIVGNAFAGWNGEIPGQPTTSGNTGTMTFRRLTLEWNGCSENYPSTTPVACWSAYGDGMGTARTGGTWLFEDSSIRFNTSDGLDMLYLREPNSSLTVRRTRFEGNAGNALKNYRGAYRLDNSVVIGNCDFFVGKAYGARVGHCRAGGNALSLGLTPGDLVYIFNNTIVGNGDGLLEIVCQDGFTCNGTERIHARNNIFQGYGDVMGGGDAFLVYLQNLSHDPVRMDYSIINNVKNDECRGSHSKCDVDAKLMNPALTSFDARLQSTSPAIDSGIMHGGIPTVDFTKAPRDSMPDIGAYEYRQ